MNSGSLPVGGSRAHNSQVDSLQFSKLREKKKYERIYLLNKQELFQPYIQNNKFSCVHSARFSFLIRFCLRKGSISKVLSMSLWVKNRMDLEILVKISASTTCRSKVRVKLLRVGI